MDFRKTDLESPYVVRQKGCELKCPQPFLFLVNIKNVILNFLFYLQDCFDCAFHRTYL